MFLYWFRVEVLPFPNKMNLISEYRIITRQEPDRGRMCGLGDSVSRRMLDPPLVLQVVFATPLSKEQLYAKSMQLLCSVHLLESLAPEVEDDAGDTDQISCATLFQTSIKSHARPQADKSCIPVLLGTTCINANVLNDLDGTQQMFFVFCDLAVRLQGHFQLSWTVVDMYDCGSYIGILERWLLLRQTLPGSSLAILLKNTLAPWVIIQLNFRNERYISMFLRAGVTYSEWFAN